MERTTFPLPELNLTRSQIKAILAKIASKTDGYNELLRLMIEAIMESERQVYKEAVGDVGNGYRPRRIIYDRLVLSLRVPRTRFTNFYPVILAILSQWEEEAKEIAFKLYSMGLTTEQIGDIFETLYGRSYSKSQISKIFSGARQIVKQWLNRPLNWYYPIVYIDATFIYTRRGGQVSKEAYYTVLGVKPDRTREVLAIVNFPTESSQGWQEVIGELKRRGVRRIDLFVSDALPGIEDAIATHFSSASVQLCAVHLKRNILKKVKKEDRDSVKSDLEKVFVKDKADDSPQKGWQRWLWFIDKYSEKYPSLKRMHQARYMLYFTYLSYDVKIRAMIYSTNWIERLNREYKRTVRMRGAMPSSEAVIILLGGVAMEYKAFGRKVPHLDNDQSFDWED